MTCDIGTRQKRIWEKAMEYRRSKKKCINV